MANILITGSRNITDKVFVVEILRRELQEGDVIIHGGAQGVDSIAQDFCDANIFCSVVMKAIHPEKKEYYLYRNVEMIGMCDRVLAFWDGKSRGTDFTIRYAKARNIDVKIFNPNEGEEKK